MKNLYPHNCVYIIYVYIYLNSETNKCIHMHNVIYNYVSVNYE